MKEKVERALTEAFIINLYSPESPPTKTGAPGEYVTHCPFHGDKHKSFSFNADPQKGGVYHCHAAGCGVSGNIYTFVKDYFKTSKPLSWLATKLNVVFDASTQGPPLPSKPKQEIVTTPIKKKIPVQEILQAKQTLFQNEERLNFLKTIGFDEEIIKKFDLGFSDGRYCIPIKDDKGDFVNVRRYKPGAEGRYKVISYTSPEGESGYGENRLWPIENINAETVFIFEGEKDVLRSMSLKKGDMFPLSHCSITNTVGAGNWKKEWGTLFKNKNVIICMDIDSDGERGAEIRAQNIQDHAAQIKIVQLPLDHTKYPKGDFSNYITDEGYTLEDFLTLVQKTKPLMAKDTVDKESNVILSEASKNHLINKKCLIKNVMCCGKDTSPFAVPKTVEVKCTGSGTDNKCAKCVLNTGDFKRTFSKDDSNLLSYIKVKDGLVHVALKRNLGINTKCNENKIKTKEYFNVENIRLVPEITYNIDENYEHVYRNAYYVMDEGKYIQTNKSYCIHALTTLEKQSQHVIHQIYKVEESESNLDNWQLTEDMLKKLGKFRPKKNLGETVESKLHSKYEEYEKAARIYGRNDVFAIMDLSFHSALTFNFQGKNIGKGWVEVCVLGDTRLGKTEQSKFLSRHYRSGEFISGESANYAGLVGGLSQHAGAWTLQWGSIPLNDRRLVIVDETSGIPEEDIGKFSEIRSSGEAKIHKIVQEKTRARTRIIWISNPRRRRGGGKSALKINQYPYGIIALKEVFGTPEDVGRLDAAIIVGSGEVDADVMNKKPEPFLQKYDSDSCHNLVQFAHSRKAEDIWFSDGTTDHILKQAVALSKKYSPNIPLLEPADTRMRLARMAVSVAIMCFNINDEHKVVVENEHVDYVCNLLDKVYNKDACGFRRYSLQEFQKEKLLQPKEVAKILGLQEDFKLDELMNSPTVSKSGLMDMLEDDLSWDPIQEPRKRRLRNLKRYYAIREHSNYFVLQPGLMNLIKDLKQWYENGGNIDTYWEKKAKDIEKDATLD